MSSEGKVVSTQLDETKVQQETQQAQVQSQNQGQENNNNNKSGPKNGGGRRQHGNRRNRNRDIENNENLTEEQKSKIQARKNINRTFDRKVNTKSAKFTPLRKFGNSAKADSITVTCNKGENKIKVTAVMVMSDLAKNKTTIRKESTIVDEIHNLPPFIKNRNLFGKIEAKFYKGQGVILNLPERPRNSNRNKHNKEEGEKSDDEVTTSTNNNDEQQTEGERKEKFQEVDIGHILETAVDLEIKFE